MSFELNKFFGGLLMALIIGIVAGLVATGVVPNETPEKPAYPIAVKAEAGGGAAAESAASGSEKPAPLTPDQLAKADPAKGEEIAKKCAQCHSWEKGGGNKVGPNLYGVIDRARASVPGFAYSDAVKGLGGNWTPQDIAAFIFKPSQFVPGTKMTFPGLPSPQDRADVLAFLNKESDTPVDLTK